MVKKAVDLDLKMNEQFVASKGVLYHIAENYIVYNSPKTHGLGEIIYLTVANWIQEIVADLEDEEVDRFDGEMGKMLNFKDGTCVFLDSDTEWVLQLFIEGVLKG